MPIIDRHSRMQFCMWSKKQVEKFSMFWIYIDDKVDLLQYISFLTWTLCLCIFMWGTAFECCYVHWWKWIDLATFQSVCTNADQCWQCVCMFVLLIYFVGQVTTVHNVSHVDCFLLSGPDLGVLRLQHNRPHRFIGCWLPPPRIEYIILELPYSEKQFVWLLI